MKVKKIKTLPLERAVNIYKAIADDSRLRILSLMMKYGEICVSDLEIILDFTQTKTSRHTTYLKNAGLLGRRKHEKWMLYFIRDEYKEFIEPAIESIAHNELIENDLKSYYTLYSNNTLTTRHIHNLLKKYSLPEY
ncbi:MAG: metalloregulator ArsR/SmtB family transcription factor [Bacteroidia bacterium]|nr:metalloregulator ArsR/SmtB family transcription factor [Bacteroidia bacterium]